MNVCKKKKKFWKYSFLAVVFRNLRDCFSNSNKAKKVFRSGFPCFHRVVSLFVVVFVGRGGVTEITTAMAKAMMTMMILDKTICDKGNVAFVESQINREKLVHCIFRKLKW